MPNRNLDVFDIKKLPLEIETVIIGVDPGVTTGVSVIAFSAHPLPDSPADVPLWGSAQLSYGESGNASDVIEGEWVEQEIARKVASIALAFRSHGIRVIFAIEDFIIRKTNTSRDFLSPVRITSGILQELRQEKFKGVGIEISMQTSADAKSICTDDRMNKWGYHVKSQRDRHSRDADRHAVLCLRYLIEKKNRSFSRLQTF